MHVAAAAAAAAAEAPQASVISIFAYATLGIACIALLNTHKYSSIAHQAEYELPSACQPNCADHD